MQNYTLSRFLYLKYYVLVLYYKLMEYPKLARMAAIIICLCLVTIVVLLIRSVVVTRKEEKEHLRVQESRKRYFDRMREVALCPEVLEEKDIARRIGLPARYKMKVKQNRSFVPVLLELYKEVRDSVNKVNWRRLLSALKMPAYFDRQIRSNKMRNRIMALKNIADMNADLKEAVASRYLYARDSKLKMNARFHVARFGTTYPFKVLEEDTNLQFTEEMMVKYHNVLVYRSENGLPMPNFVQWCNRVPVNEDLREFAVNEIRLFRQTEDCPDLLMMLRSTHDQRFGCALIKALGQLQYLPAEEELLRRYASASQTERLAICEALGNMGSANPEVVSFLEKAYKMATDYVTGMKLLRILYNYGTAGRDAYYRLKERSAREYLALFEHIECPLIKSERYA